MVFLTSVIYSNISLQKKNLFSLEHLPQNEPVPILESSHDQVIRSDVPVVLGTSS